MGVNGTVVVDSQLELNRRAGMLKEDPRGNNKEELISINKQIEEEIQEAIRRKRHLEGVMEALVE